MANKRLLKKLYGVEHFYTDPSKRFEFYFRRNWLHQFDVTVYDTTESTNRWFMVTPPVFYTMASYVEYGNINFYKRNILEGSKPSSVNKIIKESDFKLIAHKKTKYAGESVLAKAGQYHIDEDETGDVLLLKRVAFIPEMNNVELGMDTLEIPRDGVEKLVNIIKKKYFKDVEIELDGEEE